MSNWAPATLTETLTALTKMICLCRLCKAWKGLGKRGDYEQLRSFVQLIWLVGIAKSGGNVKLVDWETNRGFVVSVDRSPLGSWVDWLPTFRLLVARLQRVAVACSSAPLTISNNLLPCYWTGIIPQKTKIKKGKEQVKEKKGRHNNTRQNNRSESQKRKEPRGNNKWKSSILGSDRHHLRQFRPVDLSLLLGLLSMAEPFRLSPPK